jgi:hypothetical protein
MSAFLNSCMKTVIGLTRQDEILREFAFSPSSRIGGDAATSFANRLERKKFVRLLKALFPAETKRSVR